MTLALMLLNNILTIAERLAFGYIHWYNKIVYVNHSEETFWQFEKKIQPFSLFFFFFFNR